jgi:hypothetical protein
MSMKIPLAFPISDLHSISLPGLMPKRGTTSLLELSMQSSKKNKDSVLYPQGAHRPEFV